MLLRLAESVNLGGSLDFLLSELLDLLLRFLELQRMTVREALSKAIGMEEGAQSDVPGLSRDLGTLEAASPGWQ